MYNGCPDSFFSIDHSRNDCDCLSDLTVSSLAAFEACAVNRNTCFSVPDAATCKRGIRTQCNVAIMSGANCGKTVNKTYCVPGSTCWWCNPANYLRDELCQSERWHCIKTKEMEVDYRQSFILVLSSVSTGSIYIIMHRICGYIWDMEGSILGGFLGRQYFKSLGNAAYLFQL